MAQSCSANSLNLKYLRSPAVRLDNKCQFSCVCSEFCFMTFWLQPQRTSSSKWGSCISCSSQTCFAVILNFIQGRMETSSYCNVAAYDWILNQVQDDGYREPRLEEGMLVNQEDMFGRCQHIHPTNLRMNRYGFPFGSKIKPLCILCLINKYFLLVYFCEKYFFPIFVLEFSLYVYFQDIVVSN